MLQEDSEGSSDNDSDDDPPVPDAEEIVAFEHCRDKPEASPSVVNTRRRFEGNTTASYALIKSCSPKSSWRWF